MKLDPRIISPRAKRMYDSLLGEVKGQDRALRYIVNALERLYSPLRDTEKPIGVFLALGPSGVGKTKLAEALAKYLVGDPNGFTKIHCAEFSQPHEVARLKGSPPGYIGYVDPKEDPSGAQYILGQYSIDQYYHKAISKKHLEELRKSVADKFQVDALGDELDGYSKKLEELKQQVKEIEGEIGLLEKKKRPRQKKIGRLRKKLAQLQDQLKQFTAQCEEKGEKYVEAAIKFNDGMDQAREKGWIYNHNNPPKQLLSVILFDEIEKADEDLYEHLLEIMDKGRLQLGNGLVTSFRNSFILMTSNIGRDQIARALRGEGKIGFKPGMLSSDLQEKKLDELIYKIVTEEAKNHFPPEFMGRIDKLIVFRPLSSKAMMEILELRMQELHTELVHRKCPLVIELDQSIKEFIIDRAMKYPELGARLLKSRIIDYLKDKIIALLNTGQVKAEDKILVKLEGDGENAEPSFYKES